MVNGPVRPLKLIQAHRLLLDLLSRGPVPTDVCIERAREHGIGRRTLEKARQLLPIRTTHARGTPGAAHWQMVRGEALPPMWREAPERKCADCGQMMHGVTVRRIWCGPCGKARQNALRRERRNRS